MINFLNKINTEPFERIYGLYDKALEANQQNIEAILIASYSSLTNEVDARYVNLKYVDTDKFIFFSNYESPKANHFLSHPQIATVLYWKSINTQIRMKARIKKVDRIFSNKYFANRKKEKNAIAISSRQSQWIENYEEVIENYKDTLSKQNLKKCPDYWGGYEFTPYSIEFWEGNENRINKRELFTKKDNEWVSEFLQP
tara:strand:+ start:37429 stop:38025 length:597 start_codon:yes stop_codon:yes gene_type:complete